MVSGWVNESQIPCGPFMPMNQLVVRWKAS